MRDDHLLLLASEVADGGDVDWEAELAASPPPHHAILSGLRKVAELRLRLDHLGESFSQRAGADPAATQHLDRGASARFKWGHLEVQERIGEGSFGTVHRAFDPVLQREVALKLHRGRSLGLNPRTFIDEARSLARIRHPNVVAVHGADVHDGRVGLWSDLIEGESLEEEIAARGPIPSGRWIETALALAEALAAVHGAGLVHGDVKAANVVRTREGAPVLMDFGAASGHFGSPAVAGSPLSMAPELFAGKEATPASDVYALGVLLYRLATGRYPFSAGSVEELERLHRSEPPIRPPRLRGQLGRAIARLLVLLLERRPQARPAAVELAERIRWIRALPARRRRRAMLTALVGSLLVGTVLSSIGFLHARRSERETRAVNAFLRQVLVSPRPAESGRRTTLLEALDDAARDLDRHFGEDPLLLARMQILLGETYREQGDRPAVEKARELFARAHASLGSRLGPRHRQTIEAGMLLGRVAFDQRRYDDAELLLLDALQQAEAVLSSGDRLLVRARLWLVDLAFVREALDDAERWLEEARSLRRGERWRDDPMRPEIDFRRAQILIKRGEFAGAEALLRESLEWHRREHGERDSRTLLAARELSRTLERQGKYGEAEELVRRSLQVATSWLGSDSPSTLSLLGALGILLSDQGKLEEALEVNARALEVAERLDGPDREATLSLMANRAVLLEDLGRLGDAERLYRESDERLRAVVGPRHTMTLLNRANLAELLYETGRAAESKSWAQRAYDGFVEVVGSDHLMTSFSGAILGAATTALGRPLEGEALLRAVLERQVRTLGEHHPHTLKTRVFLARSLGCQRHDEEALELLALVRERPEALPTWTPERLDEEARRILHEDCR